MQITSQELKKKIDNNENFILIDVREPAENEENKIEKETESYLFPLAEIEDKVDDLDPQREYVLYCRSGNRSAEALEFMNDMGFQNVKHLKGGIIEWAIEVDPSMEII